MSSHQRRLFNFPIGFLLTLVFFAASASAQTPPSLPSDYRLVYSQNFEGSTAESQFVATDSNAWRIGSLSSPSGATKTLELHQQSQYKPPHRSPFNMAYIDSLLVGDFILDVKLLQTGREYGHRDMCLFFGYQDPAHFYYVHMATATDDHAHNIFIVNDAPRIKISKRTTKGVEWGTKIWHHVRLVRKASTGLIQVYYDDMETPIMEATDKSFQSGHIGFGSFDDTGMIDDIKIWAPEIELKSLKPFQASQ